MPDGDVDGVLDALGAKQCYYHEPVASAAEQVTALESQGCRDASRVAKNLFLKMQDNRNRFYLCTALHDTVVPFSKELAVRLGLKKSELRMAPPEALRSTLSVEPGSVTPLAAVRPSAGRVIVLLDVRLRDSPFYVHPVDNRATAQVTAAQLDAFFSARGRTAHYVDLSLTDVKVDRDHPPDLKAIADTVPMEKAKPDGAAAAAATNASAAPLRATQSAVGSTSGKAKASQPQPTREDIDNVATVTTKIIDMTVARVQDSVRQSREGLSAAERRLLAMDIEMELNALRNASYARGMGAATGAAVAHLSGAWR